MNPSLLRFAVNKRSTASFFIFPRFGNLYCKICFGPGVAGSPELCRDNLLIPEVLVSLQLGEDDPGNPPDILFFELSSMGAMSFEALF